MVSDKSVTQPVMAAAKVFAIPELLEHTLIQIARRNETDQQADSQRIKALFRLQGVNTLFQKTIERSRKCRRAMFLEYAYEECNEANKHLARFNPLVFDALSIDHKSFSSKFSISENRLNCLLDVQDSHLPPIGGLRLLSRFYSAESELPKAPARLQNENDCTPSWQQSLICNMPATVVLSVAVVSRGRRSMQPVQEHEVSTLGELRHLVVKEAHKGSKNVDDTAWESLHPRSASREYMLADVVWFLAVFHLGPFLLWLPLGQYVFWCLMIAETALSTFQWLHR